MDTIEKQLISTSTMTTIKTFTPEEPMSFDERTSSTGFLFEHLGPFGDKFDDIHRAIDFAMDGINRPGGFVLNAYLEDELVGVLVMNNTGMGGYIPEHILVYIATHEGYRGKGIGRSLMEAAIETARGDIALHVEPDNPAKKLYDKLGFTHKYLEMRFAQKR